MAWNESQHSCRTSIPFTTLCGRAIRRRAGLRVMAMFGWRTSCNFLCTTSNWPMSKKRGSILSCVKQNANLCLKCSHLFNILDARGAISVTERVGVIARVRALAVGIAKAYVDQQKGETPASADQAEPAVKRPKAKKELVPAVS